MARNGSQRLPTAPYEYKHTLLLFGSSMTPTDFQRLPLRELTPQPYSILPAAGGRSHLTRAHQNGELILNSFRKAYILS